MYREEGRNRRWKPCTPPSDWPEADYKAIDLDEDRPSKPEISQKFYLAASVTECLKIHEALKSEFGRMICEPDLYLKFASTRLTPSAILDLANMYGLLNYPIGGSGKPDPKSVFTFKPSRSPKTAAAFPLDPIEKKMDKLSLFIEPAEAWLRTHASINRLLRISAEYQADDDREAMSSFLEDGYNYAMGGSLTFLAKIDPTTGKGYSEIIASSLSSMLEVQWGMSVVADTSHRQCEECPTWFNVAPGSGRPEKQYCSDACRMRAYRKRKAQGSRRKTPKTQRSP